MGVLHLAGGGLLLCAGPRHPPAEFLLGDPALRAALYARRCRWPTPSPSPTFRDAAHDFPLIRVFGHDRLDRGQLVAEVVHQAGSASQQSADLAGRGIVVLSGPVFARGCRTPRPMPKRSSTRRVRACCREPSFAVFFGVSFLISLALAFYFSFTAIFLEKKVGVRSDNVGPLMTIGQWAELGLMFSLSWFSDDFGMKWVLAMGMAAWGIRYGFFAMGKPLVADHPGHRPARRLFRLLLCRRFHPCQQHRARAIAASAQSLSPSSPTAWACISAPRPRAG